MPLKEKRGRKEQENRVRVANWQHGETILLLEEIRLERTVLLSAHCAEITHKKKEQVWTKIANKVTTAFGVAPRTAFKCREKWGTLKAAAIKQSRHGAETGGGGPPKQFLPSDIFELVMVIIGEKSAVLNGIQDQDQVDYEEHRGSEEDNKETVFTIAVPSHQSVIHVDLPNMGASGSQSVSEEVPSTLPMDTEPHIIDAVEGPTTPIKIQRLTQRKFSITGRLPYARPRQQNSSLNTSTPRVSRNGSSTAENDSLLFNQYLQSEIAKNEEMINFYSKASNKVSLEVLLLKQAVKEKLGALALTDMSDEDLLP